MGTIIALCLAGFVSMNAGSANDRVRRIAVKPDQIVPVRTAVGIATIIQVPDNPNSVVVGDQGAFKVEYLDRAITIKPLSSGAKSNLYVYTEWNRYSVQLVAGGLEAADYIVYLENPKTPPIIGAGDIIWMKVKNRLKNESLSLEMSRVGRSKRGVLILEFTIRGKEPGPLRSEWLWVTQNGVVRPIQSLFLSSLRVSETESISGTIQLLSSDVDPDTSFRVELRRAKVSYLTLPKAASWK